MKRNILFIFVIAFCIFSTNTVQSEDAGGYVLIGKCGLPSFEINNIEVRSEFPNLGQTFVYYDFIVNATASEEVNMSQFYFDISDVNGKESFKIKGGELGKIKFPNGPRIARKGETWNFIFKIKFEEEGNYELYLMQGLEEGYPVESATAREEIRDETLANMMIVSPVRYQELKMNRDFIETTKSTTNWTKNLVYVTIFLVFATIVLAYYNHRSISQSKENTERTIKDNAKFRKIEFLDKRLENLYTPLINNWNQIKTFSEIAPENNVQDKERSQFYEIKKYTHLASNELKPLLERFFEICDTFHPQKDTDEIKNLKDKIEKQLEEDAKRYRDRLIELRK
jgi:hypothetical protein